MKKLFIFILAAIAFAAAVYYFLKKFYLLDRMPIFSSKKCYYTEPESGDPVGIG